MALPGASGSDRRNGKTPDAATLSDFSKVVLIWFYEKMKESLISTGRKNFENGKMTHWDNLEYRINFFAAGFIDMIHTWLQKKDRTPEQMAKFLLEMLVQLRS